MEIIREKVIVHFIQIEFLSSMYSKAVNGTFHSLQICHYLDNFYLSQYYHKQFFPKFLKNRNV